MTTKTRKPWLANLVWAAALLLGLAVLYPISYAPVARVIVGTNMLEALDPKYDPLVTAYKPVLLWLGESKLREPLMWWADVWEIREVASIQIWKAAGSPLPCVIATQTARCVSK